MTEPLVSRRQITIIAWPIILSNLSTPLLGLVDTAVIGNLGDAALLGGIAVGAMLFSFLFWGFGFLRMGTTGLVAQAVGARNEAEVKGSFYRALGIGLTIGIILLFLQQPISQLFFRIVDGSPGVEAAAASYFQIRIWGSPFNLALLAALGYFLGVQATRHLLVVQLLLNGTNIVLDLLFVVVLDWGVAGVATATVIAELVALIFAIYLVANNLLARGATLTPDLKVLTDRVALRQMFIVNLDIMIRTLCLIFGFAWFTNQGAKSGDVILATNAILMQFVSFAAFFLDGFSLAAESLVGFAKGGQNRSELLRTIRLCAELAFATALVTSVIFALTGTFVINALTNVSAVVSSADEHFFWVVVTPVIAVWCYLLDGIFIGATRTREMRNAMIISLGIFLLSWYLLHESFGNHGLWASLMIYFLARAVTLLMYFPRITRFDT